MSFPADGRTADELMITADEAMYASKRGGKDRVTGVSIPIRRTGRGPDAGGGQAAGSIGDSGVASAP